MCVFQFVLNPSSTGEIEPEFQPIQLVFREDEEYFTKDNFSELISENDIFATLYQHTTGIQHTRGQLSNFFMGRLKETPYQIYSYYRQESDGSQFITLSLFELEDEVELFEDLIKNLASRLEVILQTLVRAKNSKQIDAISNVNIRLANELKFTLFQIERLSNLDKLQKVALIYNSKERLELLNILREKPALKEEIKKKLERINPATNIDILIRPLLELNLIRRDWSKGEKDEKTGIIKNQGEYLFLTKDIILARIPSEMLLTQLNQTRKDLFRKYKQKAIDFFSNYNPITEPIEEKKKLASILLNPDLYDFFALLRNNFYPMDKIPKVFSDFAVTDIILNNLKDLNIITEIQDDENRSWIILLSDIKPLVVFPEYLLPKIRYTYRTIDEEKKVPYEIAKKAYDLLEITYPDKVEF
ncbi:MAG: hypothetical protein ACFFAN_10605 [Promethearchaeota archaeon]